MNQQDKIRQNIRDIRESKKLTQQDMAERLNLSVTGYSKIERGETELTAKRLYQIAEALEIGLYDLVPNTNDGVVVFNNNDNFSNFNLMVGNHALESEIYHLRYMIEAKDELLNARDREIEALKNQIISLQKLITALEA